MADVSRRDALRKIAVGGAAAVNRAVVGRDAGLGRRAACGALPGFGRAGGRLGAQGADPAQNETVITLAELIIPQTDTAGATKANVNRFIDAVLADASTADRQKFLDGLAWLDTQSQRDAGVPFAKASAAHQTALLTALSTNKAPSAAEQRPAWTSSRPSSR